MWSRREVLGVLGTGPAGLALLTNRSKAGDDQGHPGAEHSEMLKDCAEACGHCEAACNEAFHHCITLAAAGKAEHARMAQLVVDCAAFCTLSAAMIARHSALMVESCRACAEACRRCAEECGSADHEVMKKCATSCKKCEESCRKMVRAMGGEHHHDNQTRRGQG
jgi:hypothetical protein